MGTVTVTDMVTVMVIAMVSTAALYRTCNNVMGGIFLSFFGPLQLSSKFSQLKQKRLQNKGFYFDVENDDAFGA